MCQETPRGHLHPETPWGQLRSSGQWFSLNSPSTLSCFFPLDSTSVDPKGTPNTHPNVNLHLNLYPGEPTSNMYQKKKRFQCSDFHLKITGCAHTYNILKSPKRIQKDKNRTLCVNAVTFGLKCNLMFSDQSETYILVTKQLC